LDIEVKLNFWGNFFGIFFGNFWGIFLGLSWRFDIGEAD
jgi:hypothetical protein